MAVEEPLLSCQEPEGLEEVCKLMAMELAYVKLSDEEVVWALQGVPGWHVVDDQIQKTFKFDTYLGGLDFAVGVGQVAEDLDHHPNILVLYKAVTISMNTHSVGGISPYDFELAKRIDALGA